MGKGVDAVDSGRRGRKWLEFGPNERWFSGAMTRRELRRLAQLLRRAAGVGGGVRGGGGGGGMESWGAGWGGVCLFIAGATARPARAAGARTAGRATAGGVSHDIEGSHGDAAVGAGASDRAHRGGGGVEDWGPDLGQAPGGLVVAHWVVGGDGGGGDSRVCPGAAAGAELALAAVRASRGG